MKLVQVFLVAFGAVFFVMFVVFEAHETHLDIILLIAFIGGWSVYTYEKTTRTFSRKICSLRDGRDWQS